MKTKATAELQQEIEEELEKEDPKKAEAILNEALGNQDDTESS
jgi:hypothetical protein